MALIGVLSIVFGFLLVAFPLAGALSVVWIIGAYALAAGVVMIALAFKLRSLRTPSGEAPHVGHAARLTATGLPQTHVQVATARGRACLRVGSWPVPSRALAHTEHFVVERSDRNPQVLHPRSRAMVAAGKASIAAANWWKSA